MEYKRLDLRRYYEEEGRYQNTKEIYKRYQHQIRRYWIDKMLDVNSKTLFLDIGSGEGIFTIDVAKKC